MSNRSAVAYAAFCLTMLLASCLCAEAAACQANSTTVLTITGPSTSLSKCKYTAKGLSKSFAAFGVTFVRPFSCACAPIQRGAATCNATLTAQLKVPGLLQLYANLWASPVNGTYGNISSIPLIRQTNPTCDNSTCADLLSRRAFDLLGAACTNTTSAMTTYMDSCGGRARMPFLCNGSTLLLPFPKPVVPSPSPKPSPSPSPSPTSSTETVPKCTFFLSGPTTSLTKCSLFMGRLQTSPDFLVGLSKKPTFSGCGECLTGRVSDSTCRIGIQGTFYSKADMLQFYANAGALPVSTSDRHTFLQLPPSKSTLPANEMIDLFMYDTASAVLDGCGPARHFEDTCGGVSNQDLIVECPGIMG